MHNSKQHKDRKERLECPICQESELKEVYAEILEKIALGISEGTIKSVADINTEIGSRQLRKKMFAQANKIVKKFNKK